MTASGARIRPIAGLLLVLGLSALLAAEPAAAQSVADSSTAKQLPAGPHIILTVPVVLHSLPPEVNQYRLACTLLESGRPFGGGVVVTGAIKGSQATVGVDFATKVTVEFSLAPGSTLNDLQLYSGYRCILGLERTAGGGTATYFLQHPNNKIPPSSVIANWTTGGPPFPLQAGATEAMDISGTLPP